MPFIPHTPESLIPRSDSKSAATTCKGITLSGRPCRRDLKAQQTNDGILAVVTKGNRDSQGAAAYFCYQHKEQAKILAKTSPPTGATGLYPLNKRSSTDTLNERLGFLNVKGERSGRKIKEATANKDGLPQKWQDVPGPLLAISSSERPGSRPKTKHRRPHPLLALFCCGFYDHEDVRPSAAPIPRKEAVPWTPGIRNVDVPPRTRRTMRSSSARPALADKSTNQHLRPSMRRDPSSQTENLLALIPKTLSPQTTSLLLSELAKPVSPHDEEGYIYMFWLTPTGTGTPQPKDATAFLPSSPKPSPGGRRASSSLRCHTSSTMSPDTPTNPILLKIGRASNVQRRMNEWTRQCGYDLSLIRFYPYLSSSASPLPSPSSRKSASLPPTAPATSVVPRKVSHAHKVERLIHLELAEKRVKRDCEACGKEHREWFEVNGDREGVKGVDEVIRRWVAWGERK
ncbi:MAG: hypothetical protein Q9172_003016 [Xanthocarpia lactea]